MKHDFTFSETANMNIWNFNFSMKNDKSRPKQGRLNRTNNNRLNAR